MTWRRDPYYDDAPLHDVEEAPLKRRKCVHEGVHAMENPCDDEENKGDEQP